MAKVAVGSYRSRAEGGEQNGNFSPHTKFCLLIVQIAIRLCGIWFRIKGRWKCHSFKILSTWWMVSRGISPYKWTVVKIIPEIYILLRPCNIVELRVFVTWTLVILDKTLHVLRLFMPPTAVTVCVPLGISLICTFLFSLIRKITTNLLDYFLLAKFKSSALTIQQCNVWNTPRLSRSQVLF